VGRTVTPTAAGAIPATVMKTVRVLVALVVAHHEAIRSIAHPHADGTHAAPLSLRKKVREASAPSPRGWWHVGREMDWWRPRPERYESGESGNELAGAVARCHALILLGTARQVRGLGTHDQRAPDAATCSILVTGDCTIASLASRYDTNYGRE
jgi:hypothetical protein